jgi:linear primary-alkylsulfatase
MSLDLFFDYLAVRLDAGRAEGKTLTVNWVLPDTGERYALTLEHCALTYRAGRPAPAPDATVTLDRAALDRLILRELTFADAVSGGLVVVDGDAARVAELFGLFDDFTLMFPVVEPRPEGDGPA